MPEVTLIYAGGRRSWFRCLRCPRHLSISATYLYQEHRVRCTGCGTFWRKLAIDGDWTDASSLPVGTKRTVTIVDSGPVETVGDFVRRTLDEDTLRRLESLVRGRPGGTR